jgi:rSAM/selenodomain-associated transferase 1
MTVTFPDTRILIFARAPLAGEVKTRLIPVLGKEGAARLQARLLEQILGMALESRLAPVQLWCTPDTTHPLFQKAELEGVSLYTQQGDDLGQRMQHALDSALQEGGQAVLIGTDCPLMDAGYLAAAIEALCGHEVVLGPAEDGGYVLLGVNRAGIDIYRGIEWGSDQVMQQTRALLQQAGIDWQELATLWDVDRPEDLSRLRSWQESRKETVIP